MQAHRARYPYTRNKARSIWGYPNSTGTGTLGRTAVYRGKLKEMTADSHVTIVRAKKGVSGFYLGYFLNSHESLLESLGRGATNQKELSGSDLKKLKIHLPDYPTQKHIGRDIIHL